MKLTELFEPTSDYFGTNKELNNKQWGSFKVGEYMTQFKSDNEMFLVKMHLYENPDVPDNTYVFGFQNVMHTKDDKAKRSEGEYGNKEALKIFSTISSTMVAFIEQKKPSMILFTPATDKLNRLYGKMVLNKSFNTNLSKYDMIYSGKKNINGIEYHILEKKTKGDKI